MIRKKEGGKPPYDKRKDDNNIVRLDQRKESQKAYPHKSVERVQRVPEQRDSERIIQVGRPPG